MSNPPNWRDADLSAIDPRAMTSLEWTAVKAEVNRRASAERNALLRRIWRRWRTGWRRVMRGFTRRPTLTPSKLGST